MVHSATIRAAPTVKDAVFSCGGLRILTSGAGILAALEACRFDRTHWRSLTGISGGSSLLACYAYGVPVGAIVSDVIDRDPISLFDRRRSPLNVQAYFQKEKEPLPFLEMVRRRFQKERPPIGLLNPAKFHAHIAARVPTWPEQFITMAVAEPGDVMMLLKHDGMFAWQHRQWVKVGDPISVADAICGSSAVPGAIDGRRAGGHLLFDGGLSPLGRCPVAIPQSLFDATSADILAADVGEDPQRSSRLRAEIWRLICGGKCIGLTNDLSDKALHSIHPSTPGVRTLDLSVSKHLKWAALMDGFKKTVFLLDERRIIEPHLLDDARAIVEAHKKIVTATASDNLAFCQQMRELFTQSGLLIEQAN